MNRSQPAAATSGDGCGKSAVTSGVMAAGIADHDHHETDPCSLRPLCRLVERRLAESTAAVSLAQMGFKVV